MSKASRSTNGNTNRTGVDQQEPFILQLMAFFPKPVWPWALIALRQDATVWDALQNTDLGRRALQALPPQAELWTPASLALLALGAAQKPQDLTTNPMQPVDETLQLRADQALAAWIQTSGLPLAPTVSPAARGRSAPTAFLTLVDAGLLALGLRERYRQNSTWKGLLAEAAVGHGGLGTILACLHGMLPEPERLLRALVREPFQQNGDRSEGKPRPDLALHILLSTPQPPEATLASLQALIAELPPSQVLALLRGLLVQRPQMAASLAGEYANREAVTWVSATGMNAFETGGVEQKLTPAQELAAPAELDRQFDQLADALRQAQIYQVALQPDRAVPVLAEALRELRRLRGYLSARLAQVMEHAREKGDETWRETALETSLEAWKQAVLLTPDSPRFTVGLAGALAQSGRLADARACLKSRQQEVEEHPSLLLASAALADQQGSADERQEVRRQVLRAFKLARANPEDLSASEYETMTSLFLEEIMPKEAADAADLGLSLYPQQPALLGMAAQAQHQLGRAERALSCAYAALALAELTPDIKDSLGDLSSLIVQDLEAVGAWGSALDEREAHLEGVEKPSSEDLHALIRCAENAGQSERLAQACRKTLQHNPSDLLALQRLAETSLASGDPSTAARHLSQAVRLAPDQPALWLALVDAYRQSGQEAQAFDALRTASQAAPDDPAIHFALGEVYQSQGAPTQALGSFRRAKELISAGAASHAGPDLPQKIDLRLGQTLFQLGHQEEARQVLGEAYLAAYGDVEKSLAPGPEGEPAKQPDLEMAYSYARALLAAGDVSQAIYLLTYVVRMQPEEVGPALDLAQALMKIGDQPAGAQRALPFLQRLLGLGPDGSEGGYYGRLDTLPVLRAEARALLAEAYAATGDWTRAMDAYRRALEEPLNREAGRQARLSTGLGMVALKLDQPEMAVAALQEAAHAEPLNVGVQRALSDAYLTNGLAQDAFQAASAALDLQPDNLDTLIWFTGQAQRLAQQPGASGLPIREQMVQALRTATELSPERPDLLLRLGQLALESGDRTAALDAYHKLASLESTDTSLAISDLYHGAQAIRQLGDAASAVLLLRRAIQQVTATIAPGGSTSLTAENAAGLNQLYTELAYAYQEEGNLEAALGAVDRALTLQEAQPGLLVQRADLLSQLNRPEAALESLRQAIRMAPHDPALRQRTAQILRMQGDLPGALAQAEQGISVIDHTTQGEPALSRSLYLLASELAYFTLRPRKALAYLMTALPENDEAYNDLAYASLRAEAALDLGDEALASQAVEVMMQAAPDSPRSLAASSRLRGLIGDDDERGSRCRSAVRALIKQQMNQTPITPPSTKEAYVASFLAVAQAALESRAWEDALSTLDRLIEIIPETPLAYFKKAQVLTSRAEAQCLCQDLEVVRHAPGLEALSGEASQACLSCMAEAQARLAAGSDLEKTEDLKPWEDECQQKLGLWAARSRAVFQPAQTAAVVLESILRVVLPAAEDVAALIMAYRRCGERERAQRAAEITWRATLAASDEQPSVDIPPHPLVAAQLAMAHTDLGLAVAAAQGALQQATARDAETNSSGTNADKPSGNEDHPNAIKLATDWPETPMLHFLVARLAYQAGSLQVAAQAIGQALAAWQDEARWQALAARIYLGKGQAGKAQAMAHLEGAVALEPDNAAHYLALGQLYLEEGQGQRAIQSLEQATQLDPHNAEAWLAQAQAHYASTDLQAAAACAERAIESSADSGSDPAEALWLRGQIALQTGNPRGAFSRAQAILRAHPHHAQALYLLAHSLEALNRPAEALAVLDKALPLYESSLVAKGIPAGGSQAEQASVKLAPDELISMQVERLNLLKRTRGLEAALVALQELITANPGQPALLSLLAEWLSSAGRREEAVQAARLALQEGQEQFTPEQCAILHTMIGLTMRQSGQLDQAIHHLSEAINLAPAHLDAYLELGRSYQERREYQQALKIYQKAISVAGSDYRPYYYAGLALKDNKDYVAAEAMLRRAAQLAPNEVSVHRLLGAVVALNLVHNHRYTEASTGTATD